ncbi:MAG: STAS domain-containing protein [Armatimonadetes bacterium]|nr:STAS domain-containing protein [Armatimonadota bacterium]
MPQPLSVEIRRSGSTIHVELAGTLDAEGAARVRAHLKPALKDSPDRVVLNLQAVAYVDQSGIDALVHAGRVAQRLGGRLVLDQCPEQVSRLLTALGHDRLLARS